MHRSSSLVVGLALLSIASACMRGTGLRCVDQLYPNTPYSTDANTVAAHFFNFDHDNACADFHVTVNPITGDPKLVVSQPRHSSQVTHSYINFMSDVRGVSGVEEVVVRALDHTAPLGGWNLAVHCDEPFCTSMTQFTIEAWEEVLGNDTHTATGTLGADERHIFPVCQPHTCGTMTLELTTTAGDDLTLLLARDEITESTDMKTLAASRLIGTDTWEIELRPDGGWLPSLLFLAVDCDSNTGCTGGSYDISYRAESGQCPPSVGTDDAAAEPEVVLGEVFWATVVGSFAVLAAGFMCKAGLGNLRETQIPKQPIPNDSGSERDSRDGKVDNTPRDEAPAAPTAAAEGGDDAPPTPRPPTARDPVASV